jgi:hypothetical protein
MLHPRERPLIRYTCGTVLTCSGFENGHTYTVYYDEGRKAMVCSQCEWVDPDSVPGICRQEPVQDVPYTYEESLELAVQNAKVSYVNYCHVGKHSWTTPDRVDAQACPTHA